ncbi:MAG: Hsp20/alpha crystallin family protein [Candidatus Omnitrophica bacterium]|nr:Hsp20/alpha crystallin family protein [Candidatus Omnitrophota bacterium]
MKREKIEFHMCPPVDMYYSDEGSTITTEIDLAGVRKRDIVLDAGKAGFCLKAKKEDLVFDSCYRFCEEVDTKRIDADFRDGMLRITAPVEKSFLHARKISVH